ncbi:MAG: [protein-PII] uridylyltransferase [bacterium]|nr:MAG: [protein-PII] uridylyltransferase [bacterium]
MLKRSDLPSPEGLSGQEGMTAFAGEVRRTYRKFLKELADRHRAGAGGLEVVRMCTAGVELVVRHLYDSLPVLMRRSVRRLPALVALGGFGRRELSPRSDVDLLFLWGKRRGGETGAFAGYLVRMMWDSGLKLGHSVRTVPELLKAIRRDNDLKTSLLDVRWICGDEELKARLSPIKQDVLDRESGELLEAKLEECRRRWQKFGWSYHLIEPNVKESPGGLRDFQTIRWIGMVLPWEGTLQGLYRLAIIDREEIADIQNAFDFLLRTRNEIHFVTQSSGNVLTVELQRAVAKGLGYRTKGGLMAVERFMRDYYTNTMAIYKVLERFLDATHGKGNLRIIDGALYKRVGTKGAGQLDLKLRREKLAEDPLFPFKEQLREGRHFSPHLERRIRSIFKNGRLDARTVKRMRSSFVEILQMPGKKAPVIRSMYELGVLKHIFPPFERLTCLKRYDLYHQYTADEHSLQAIANLEELTEREGGLLPRIYSEVAEKMELFLATLLHDIGKVKPSEHSRAGAKLAAQLLKHFPISAKSRELIQFLIINHLLLSHFSQRRDMEDRDTSMQFMKVIGNHLNLKLLYLLTYADFKATGTGVWTGWKENLLEDLYFKASRMLAEKSDIRVSYQTVLERRREKILAACRDKNEQDIMQKHLDGLPARYTMVVSPAQARSHLEMIEKLAGQPAVTRFRRLRHSIELSICTRDRPFRLSQLCGVITINDFNILGAFAFTRSDGTVIDLFHVEGVDGKLTLKTDAREKLAKDLTAVLKRKLDLEAAFEAHVKRWKRLVPSAIPVASAVEFENDLSRESTIIDLTTRDRPGLLYRITHVLSEEGLDIQSAQITTRGGVVEDSFYVRTAEGEKISAAARMRSIRRRLMAELTAGGIS